MCQSVQGTKDIIYIYIYNKACVTHYGLAIYNKKYLKAKEELWKSKCFSMQKNNLQ